MHLFWHETGYCNFVSELSNFLDRFVRWDSVGESHQICARMNERSVQWVFRVVLNVSRTPLWTRPERRTFLVFVVMGEHRQQVLDLVVEELFEVQSCFFDTFFIRCNSFHADGLLDGFKRCFSC